MIYHMCQSIRGALDMNPLDFYWTWKGVVTNDDGHVLSAKEVREYFYDELSKGHEVIPFEECDNFDFKKGCKGHKDDHEISVGYPLVKEKAE